MNWWMNEWLIELLTKTQETLKTQEKNHVAANDFRTVSKKMCNQFNKKTFPADQ